MDQSELAVLTHMDRRNIDLLPPERRKSLMQSDLWKVEEALGSKTTSCFGIAVRLKRGDCYLIERVGYDQGYSDSTSLGIVRPEELGRRA